MAWYYQDYSQEITYFEFFIDHPGLILIDLNEKEIIDTLLIGYVVNSISYCQFINLLSLS